MSFTLSNQKLPRLSADSMQQRETIEDRVRQQHAFQSSQSKPGTATMRLAGFGIRRKGKKHKTNPLLPAHKRRVRRPFHKGARYRRQRPDAAFGLNLAEGRTSRHLPLFIQATQSPYRRWAPPNRLGAMPPLPDVNRVELEQALLAGYLAGAPGAGGGAPQMGAFAGQYPLAGLRRFMNQYAVYGSGRRRGGTIGSALRYARGVRWR